MAAPKKTVVKKAPAKKVVKKAAAPKKARAKKADAVEQPAISKLDRVEAVMDEASPQPSLYAASICPASIEAALHDEGRRTSVRRLKSAEYVQFGGLDDSGRLGLFMALDALGFKLLDANSGISSLLSIDNIHHAYTTKQVLKLNHGHNLVSLVSINNEALLKSDNVIHAEAMQLEGYPVFGFPTTFNPTMISHYGQPYRKV